MRRCARSEELLEALAGQEALDPDLAAHVVGCPACTRIRAAAHRFDARLDAAMSDLVTDAVPPSTAVVARMAPPAPRHWPSPRIVASTLMAVVLTSFAAIGLVSTGTSIYDALGRDSAEGRDRAGESEAVDCVLGEPAVEVVAEADFNVDVEPAMVIAYCFDDARDSGAAGGPLMKCVRSHEGGSPRSSPPSERQAAYLSACTRVEEAPLSNTAPNAPDDAVPSPATSTPFDTWDEARAAAAWPVLRPEWLPEGYRLAALQGFAPPTEPQAINAVVATYLRSGTPMSVDQFALANPDEFHVELTLPGEDLGEVTTGQTTVRDRPAFWADGVAVQTSIGAGLDVRSLVLTWSDGQRGYRITAWDADLDELRRIAVSLGE